MISYRPREAIILTAEQKRVLGSVFRYNGQPSKYIRRKLNKQLNLPHSFISSWFHARSMNRKLRIEEETKPTTCPAFPRLPSLSSLPKNNTNYQSSDPSLYMLTNMESKPTPKFREEFKLPSLQFISGFSKF
ncbi:hypothetical protein DSO57_1022664 [Entomophthora muscae]|uniref:Uncharacterized protein n=1 Tax=Entomophthora muscae TaxID=34485 RepID=A0ACC2U0Y1_9FUNG|nr:hypothetical protein DSO57_1022664 [Entomophthora muscae]